MDPLSDVLSMLKPRSYMCAVSTWRGLSIHFGGMMESSATRWFQLLLAVVEASRAGAAWAGDCFLLRAAAVQPVERSGADPDRLPRVFERPLIGASLCGRRRDCSGVVATSRLWPECGHPAGRAAGHRSHPQGVGQGGHALVVEQMMQELREPRPGGCWWRSN